jgi:hypothetical protein
MQLVYSEIVQNTLGCTIRVTKRLRNSLKFGGFLGQRIVYGIRLARSHLLYITEKFVTGKQIFAACPVQQGDLSVPQVSRVS